MDDEDVSADLSNEDLLFAEMMMSLGLPLPPSPNDGGSGAPPPAASTVGAAIGGVTQGTSSGGSANSPSRMPGSLASALMRRLARVRPPSFETGGASNAPTESAPIGEPRRSRERIMFELLHRADALTQHTYIFSNYFLEFVTYIIEFVFFSAC